MTSMKEKKETILFGGIVILIVGLIIGVWLFKSIREYDESQKLKEYAEQICMAFENGDITTFDELCDDETVFWEQNYIYSFLREELKYNLEHKKYRVTGYWEADFPRLSVPREAGSKNTSLCRYNYSPDEGPQAS